eukprot:TRINITY_DN80199_c0_g1_i1.p1 TRINITY_DN80199_c0_g1~~TRINITY_DN80199_c0_g1_i1.p1  ORF type:complete len:236 (+),score=39.50 TRINITY_DN80199_c0_g1_i1:67-708(+)
MGHRRALSIARCRLLQGVSWLLWHALGTAASDLPALARNADGWLRQPENLEKAVETRPSLMRRHASPSSDGSVEAPGFCEDCATVAAAATKLLSAEDDEDEDEIMEHRLCSPGLYSRHSVSSPFLRRHVLGQSCLDLAECIERVIGLYDVGSKQEEARGRLIKEVTLLAALPVRSLSLPPLQGGAEDLCETLLQAVDARRANERGAEQPARLI